jgi:N6-adenosine-specific RNA methylase IME4
MWTTAPKLREAFDVIDSWGFEYVTGAVWDKQKIGMGYWFRGQHEHLLVAKRGEVSPPETGSRQSSVISAERGEHSAKPDSVYDLIEAAFPNRERLELFARDSHAGWDCWGDEIE